MKFLVDANLPPRLGVWFGSRRHEADHVFDRNLLTATDTHLWERGRAQNLVIISKDVDFYDRALLFGAPPQVVHIAVGNCGNTGLFDALAHQWDEIERALGAGSRLISVSLEKIEVFPLKTCGERCASYECKVKAKSQRAETERIREISRYRWSSLPGYLDGKRNDSWITYEAVLDYMDGSRQKYAAFVQEGIRKGFATPWEDLLGQMVLGTGISSKS